MTTWPGIISVASIRTMTTFLPLNSYLASANPASDEKNSCTMHGRAGDEDAVDQVAQNGTFVNRS